MNDVRNTVTEFGSGGGAHAGTPTPRRLSKVQAAAGLTVLCIAALLPMQSAGAATTTSWMAARAGVTGIIPPGTQTLREVISPRRAGSELKLTLSNADGVLPVTFSEVWIGQQLEGAALVSGSNKQLKFNGEPSVTLAPGEEVTSDLMPFSVEPFEKLVISMQSGPTGFPPAAPSHPVSRELNYFALASTTNAAEESASGFQPFTLTQGATFQASWHYISRLDINGGGPGFRTVVTFGDSIFDGLTVNPLVGSTFVEDITTLGADERFSDFLQKRFRATSGYGQFSVVNAGIAGNRLTAGPFAPFFGPSGLSRLEKDVIQIPGVTDAIIHLGVNDIAFDIPAQTLTSDVIVDMIIDGLKELIERLQAERIRAILGTVMPALGANASAAAPILEAVGDFTGVNLGVLHGSGMTETLRAKVNEWILTEGATLADGVIDFASCTADREDTRKIKPAFNSGDNLHPNADGFSAMADCVDLRSTFPTNFSVGGAATSGGGSLGILVLPLGALALWRRRKLHLTARKNVIRAERCS